jgi:hypothetical protein
MCLVNTPALLVRLRLGLHVSRKSRLFFSMWQPWEVNALERGACFLRTLLTPLLQRRFLPVLFSHPYSAASFLFLVGQQRILSLGLSLHQCGSVTPPRYVDCLAISQLNVQY